MQRRLWQRLLAGLLIILLTTPGLEAALVQNQLRIFIIEGEGVNKDPKSEIATVLVVQVQDSNGSPAAGAEVVFTAPTTAASGVFENGSRTITKKTDASGIAEARFRPNNVAGAVQLTVAASYQGGTGTATVAQTNISTATGSKKKLWIALLAGAGGVAAYFAFKKDKVEPPEIVPGGPVVGPN